MSKKNRHHGGTEVRLYTYVGLVALTAALTAGVLIHHGVGVGDPLALMAIAIAAAFAERWSVRFSATTVFSVSMVPIAFAAVVLGPLAAGIVGAASMLGDDGVLGRQVPSVSSVLRWITYTATGFLTGVVSGVVAAGFDGIAPTEIGSTIVMTFAAVVAGDITDFGFAALTSVARRGSLSAMTNRVVPVIVTSFLVYSPVVALLVAAYTAVSPWTTPLFLVPALALQRVYSLYQRQRCLTDDLTEANARLKDVNTVLQKANLSFATALVQTLEESDRYTAGHSRAVANYARDIAAQMGFDEKQQERLYLCGLVHDIGKIGLSAAVLNKEGRLTLEERREMERHSEIGERILAKVEAYADVAKVVRHHHERLDGEGYPDRLRNEDIPLASRIIAVADAYNAMTSDRPYRKAMDYEVARDRLLQAMGSQFFTEPVIAFLSVLANADDDYRYARSDGFGLVDAAEAYAMFVESAADAA